MAVDGQQGVAMATSELPALILMEMSLPVYARSQNTSLRIIAAYISLLIPCLLGVALLWSLCISDRLYHCWDDLPMIGFIPPFVHDVPPLASGDSDHYIAAPWIVYSTWVAFLGVALWLPFRIIRLFRVSSPSPANALPNDRNA